MKSCWYIDASVRSFFRCTKSSTIYRGLIHQCGEMKYEGVSKMSESSMLEAVKNCLIRRPKVRIAFGLASNNFIYLLANNALCAGCFGNDFILEAYCRDSSSSTQTRFVCNNVQALYRRSSKCSKTKSKSLVVYGIQHMQVRLSSGPIHNASIV